MTTRLGPSRSLERFRALPPSAQNLLIGICLAKLGASMIWPFIAVVMARRFDMSIVEIGALLSIGLFVTIFGSPVGGIFTDKFDRRRFVLAAIGLVIASYVAMAALPSKPIYILGIMAISAANCVIEPALRASLGEQADTEVDRSFIFHLRYYLVNLGVAVGPLIGLWFIERNSIGCFWLAALCYGPLLICVAKWPVAAATRQDTVAQPAPNVSTILSTALRSWTFIAILLLNFALVFIYAQTEDPLVFYLIDLGMEELTWIIAVLTVTNTVTVLVFHLLLMDRISEMEKRTAFTIGAVFLMGSLIAIAINTQSIFGMWVLAIILGTIAEFMVMPTITVMVDTVAPSNMRSSFFGIAMLPGLGAALAPYVGALGVSHLGGPVFFGLAAALCIPVGLASLRFAKAVVRVA